MALRKNVALRNAQANAFGDLFNGGTLEVRTGSQPADPASGDSGTLLCIIDLDADAFSAASGGAIAKIGTWNGVGIANGTAAHGRFKSSDTLKTFDVSIAEVGGDLTIDDDAIVIGGLVTVTTFTFTVPSGV